MTESIILDEPLIFTKKCGASQRGGDLLYDNAGNKYQFKRETDETVEWRCSNRRPHCPAIISEGKDDGKYEIIKSHSNHETRDTNIKHEIYKKVINSSIP